MFQRLKSALIHANGFDLRRYFALAASSLGIPYITHVRFSVDAAAARWVLHGLPRPSAFIFNSQAMMGALWPLVSVFALKSQQYVVHIAVELESYTPAPWPEAPPYRIGITANFAPFKRHEDFLRMTAEMLTIRRDLEFWIVGDDTEGSGRRKDLEQLAAELGITRYVRFLSHRSKIPDINRQLHLLVVTDLIAPTGLKC